MTQDRGERDASGVRTSFAWGQLIAGSLIGSLAIWKLGHKLTDTRPSDWFVGLSTAYEEVRDFVLLPVSWVDPTLTATDKNTLVATIVLVGALLRAGWQYPRIIAGLALIVLLGAALGIASYVMSSEPLKDLLGGFLFLAFMASILQPYYLVRDSPKDSDEYRAGILVLLNVVFTVICGAILLLMNWATS